jgi:TolB protein
VTVTAPPRPPRRGEPLEREEIEALVEALIEEARQRAQRRRRRNGAIVTLVALVGVALFAMLGRSAQSQTASPALSARLSSAAQAVTSKIAFISEPPSGGYCGLVYVMNADGSGQRRLVNSAESCGGEQGHAWSPDGQKIAFAAWSDQGSDMYVINADGSGQQRLTSDPEWEDGLAWSPDWRALAFRQHSPDRRYSDIYVMNVDGSERRRLVGNTVDNSWPGHLAWSPRGNEIAFVNARDGDFEIFVMNGDGPDGRRIAFESNWQVWVMNADGSGQRRLTRNGARNFAPAWSPDGQRIAFERRLGRQQSPRPCSGCGSALHFEVWVMNADGSGQQRLTRRGSQPRWSPDGRKIAFVSKRDGNADIYVMNADGSGQRNLTRGAGRHESQPVWSPAQTK